MAGTPDGKVRILIDTNAAQAARDIRQLDNEIKNLNRDAQQTKTQTNNMSGGVNNASSSLMSLKGAAIATAAAFAAMKLAQFTGDVLKISSAFEQLNVSFEVLAGKSAGAQLVADLTALANVTPMTTQGLADNARLLLSFGEASENVISDLKLLGDISGGNQQKMDMLTLAFAQAGSAGRLMGQDLLQMVNAGFNPLQIMSEKTGKSMFELKKEMEAGKISFDQIKQAMIDATSEGGRFYGMMNKQSQTLEGRLSTLADKWGLVGKAIGDFFLPAAKSAVIALTNLGDAVLRLTQLNQTYSASIPNQGLDQLKMRLGEVHRMQEKWNNAIKNAPNIATRGLMVANYTKELQKLNVQEAQIVARIKSLQGQAGKTTKAPDIGFRSSAATDFGGQVARSRKQASTVIKQATQEEINAYQQLQNKVSQLKENLYIMATQGKNSGDIWTKSLENYRLAQTQLDSVNKSIENNAVVALGSYDQLNNKISEMRINLQNMAVSGQAGTPAFDKLKNDYVEATNQMKEANRQVTNAMGLDWENIGKSISSDLASALTTPLQEGENAFTRFGNVAMNVISMIGQKLIEEFVIGAAVKGIANLFTGGTGGSIMSLFGFAKGGAFQGGKEVQAFASGGVVSSPTLFPMANGGTGLMGEAGAEAIMPLRRSSNGRLGVEASNTGGNVYVYNYSNATIETTKRPNGDTEIRIREINNALANERTQQGLSVGMSRQNSRGVTAA